MSFIASLQDPAVASLPIVELLPTIGETLNQGSRVVLHAPPGSGKTTIVPLFLRDAPWLAQRRILMLQPRRIAARAVARRMSELLGEEVGETVGYRVRFERKISRRTKIEVITEGILTRMLQSDPALEDTGLLIFDEFHERSIHSDLALTLAREAQEALRGDLRIVVMSATLDTVPLARYLDAPVLSAEGRPHPVAIHYLDAEPSSALDEYAAKAIVGSFERDGGDILTFLPAVRDIRRLEERLHHLHERGAQIAPLYGELPYEQQQEALRPARPGRRKILLATPIAETSLTIEGVRVVIDTGYHRTTRFDPGYGFDRLVTERISRDSADQRAGRAGRLGPGVCYRLWSLHTQNQLRAHRTPEILEADLASLVLELALWGARDPAALRWLDTPPVGAVAQAKALLRELGVLTADNSVTPLGKKVAALGAHPRLGLLLCRAAESRHAELGAAVAALLEERDIFASKEHPHADIEERIEEVLRSGEGRRQADRGRLRVVRQLKGRWEELLGRVQGEQSNPSDVSAGGLLARAFPDRIGLRRPGSLERASYQLSGGGAVELNAGDPLAHEELIVAARLQLHGSAASRLRLGAALSLAELRAELGHAIHFESQIEWDSRQQLVRCERIERLGALVLSRQPESTAGSELVAKELLRGLRLAGGVSVLNWSAEAAQFRARVVTVRNADVGSTLPDLSENSLNGTFEEWLLPYCDGLKSLSELKTLDLCRIVQGMLSWEQQQLLDRTAPEAITLPGGRRRPLDYGEGQPVLQATVQELFGWRESPVLGDGRLTLTLHILSPARRPLQITRSLGHFWTATYPQVRKEFRGRYPKHAWPEDPFSPLPPRKTGTGR